MFLLEIDADVNPGNSGGPVVDERDALVGVIAAKLANTNFGYLVTVPKLNPLNWHGHIDPPNICVTDIVNGRTVAQIIAREADPLGRFARPPCSTDRPASLGCLSSVPTAGPP